jgi:hypothetical protein
MPKTKTTAKKEEKKPIQKPVEELEKIIEIDEETKVDDLELIPGEASEDDPEEDEVGLDEEEVDPFKDKWEE